MNRGLFLPDQRVEPADLARGFAFSKITAACRMALIVVPAPRGPESGIQPTGLKMIQPCRFLHEYLSRPWAMVRSHIIVAPRKTIQNSNFSRTRHKVLLREYRVG